MSTAEKRPSVIVGSGAVGSALALELSRAGYPLAGIVSRSISRARSLASRTGADHALRLDKPLPVQTRQVFLCVPDDFIHAVAGRLGTLHSSWENTIVAHLSGALTSDNLAPLTDRGAEGMSFHPIQSFSNRSPGSFKGIYIGLEGSERALTIGRHLALDLGAHPIIIDKSGKKTYHLAASIASNHLVVLVGMARALLESIGCSEQDAAAMLGPLILTTAQNTTSMPPGEALTGPAVRGDINTIGFHFETLQEHFPQYLATYRAMTQQAIEMAVKSGRLDPNRAIQLKNRLR